MNRQRLDLLLAAGLLTPEQHATACAALVAGDTAGATPAINLEAPASFTLQVERDDAGAATSGVLSGRITAYDELIPSHGLIIHAGALTTRQPLDRVKLLRDHDMTQPLGYMLSHDDALENADFQVAPDELERVAREFEHKQRDGLSVGFSASEYEIDDDWIIHVHAGEIHETSLCAIPAVAGAGVTSVAAALATQRKENRTMNRAQLAAALAAGTITQEQHDGALAALDALELSARPTPPAGQVTPELAAGPELTGTQPAAPAPVVVTERLSLQQVTHRLVTAANHGDVAGFTLALADVIPADDAGAAFMREDWQGQVWRDDSTTRPWVDAFGAPAELTALNGKGWDWADADVNGDGGEPLVDEYAGNKTEVPTNEIGTEPKTWNGFRIAAGWDVDRVFEDFAAEEFWAAFWPAVMRDYKRKSNNGIRTRVIAKATAGANVTAGGVKAVLKTLVKDVRPYGKVNRIFLGDTLFEELEDLDTDNLPLWLKSATIGLDVAEGSADIGTLRILNDPDMTDNQAVAFDSRAGKVREKAPFRLQAINVARAGVDVGIYSYLRFDDYDNRAIVKRNYVAA